MQKIFTPIVLCLLTQSSFAFEPAQLSLDTPNILKQNEGSSVIRHRFYGDIGDEQTFFGTDDGGNMHLSLKYAIADNLVLGVEHTRTENAYGVGLEYAHDFEWIKLGARANGFRLNRVGDDTPHPYSYMINGSVQTPNYFDHLILTGNFGYDAFYEHNIAGIGADLNVNNFIPYLTFTSKISLLAEYYPQVDKVEGISGKYDAYAYGLKFQTFGHHFELLATNSSNMDARTMSLGTNSDEVHFGFNISRKF